MNNKSQSVLDLRVADKFKLIKKVGSGAFGEIYKGMSSNSIYCDR